MYILRHKLYYPSSFTKYIEDNEFTLIFRELPSGEVRASISGLKYSAIGYTEEESVDRLISLLKEKTVGSTCFYYLENDYNAEN